VLAAQGDVSGTAATDIPYSDAAPILRALREDLLPPELRGKTAADLEAAWPAWVSRRDSAIRARVADGDADSIIYLLQFGTGFTKQPRIGERELAGVVMRQAGGGASRFVPSPVLLARIEDFVAAVASPGTNARLQFARDVIARRGIDPGTESGRNDLRQYLQERVEVVGQAERLSRFLNPEGDAVDQMTLFRDRGLAPDTSILVDFGLEEALTVLRNAGLLQQGAVRRVAIIGPGLDFTDKQEGYDFYPEQTIQPFAVIDSLIRLGLARASDLRLIGFDLSPRVLQHLEAARIRARAGQSYTVALPRNLDQPWTPALVKYWERFGDRIGDRVRGTAAPAAAGRVGVRGASIRPSVVLSIVPQDVNIVLQRIEPVSSGDQFDLVLATNLLIYYDVFEQSLAMANVARMLRAGGVFLSNDRIFELPGSPLATVGHTSAIYLQAPGIGDRGDRIDWYQHRQ
jgi:SAM-dependent methyltransferase